MRLALTVPLALALLLAGTRAVPAQVVQGQVVDRTTRAPVSSGTVRLLDSRGEVANTSVDAEGRFILRVPAPGRYWLRFESPGYRLVLSSAIQLDAGATVSYSIETQAVPAARLDTVIVEGRPVPTRLAPFYERRARGAGGEFVTREEFERWNPGETSQIVRRVSGFTLVPNPDYGRRGDTRRYLVMSRRLGDFLGQFCPPLIFVDGGYMGTASDFDLDAQIPPENIEAMEFYSGAANIPIEFNRRGSDCGVIGIWTRATSETATSLWRYIELAPQVGLRHSRAAFRDARVGGRISLSLGPVELQGATNVILPLLGAATGEARSGWQVTAAVRVRPFHRRLPWYLGAGATSLDLNPATNRDPLFSEPRHEQAFLLLTGVSPALNRRLSPYFELQVLSPFSSERELNFYAGVGVRTY